MDTETVTGLYKVAIATEGTVIIFLVGVIGKGVSLYLAAQKERLEDRRELESMINALVNAAQSKKGGSP
jgi:hypothetical protein